MSINVELIKQLREETGAGVMDVRQTLEKFDGDIEKAREELMKKGLAKASQKQGARITKDGLVHAYIHGTGKVGSLVCVACETDFVAKTDDFKKLCQEIALQVAGEEYNDVPALMASEYIRDSKKTISDLVLETVAKVGEKIEIKSFSRLSVA